MSGSHPYNLAASGQPWERRGSILANGRRILQRLASVRDDPACDSESLDAASDTSGEQSGDLLIRLETVLFLAKEPLSARRLAAFADLPEGMRVRRLIRMLNDSYVAQSCTFQIVEVAGGFQLRTRPQFAPWLFRLQEVPIEIRLSAPAMETLAIVAYKQPLLRAEIEAIRGVQCGEIIRQLLDLELIRIAGRSEELGRPFLYTTTPRFLQVFGLKNIKELRLKDTETEQASPGRQSGGNPAPR